VTSDERKAKYENDEGNRDRGAAGGGDSGGRVVEFPRVAAATSAGAGLDVVRPAMKGQDHFLWLREVCEQLNADREYVRKLVAAGELRLYKPAPDVRARYYQSDVDRILTPRGKDGTRSQK
jgi:excisionase family DNA binding protein